MAKTTKNILEKLNNQKANQETAFDRIAATLEKIRENQEKESEKKSLNNSTSSYSKEQSKAEKTLYDDMFNSIAPFGMMLGGPLFWGAGKVLQHFGGGLKNKILGKKNKYSSHSAGGLGDSSIPKASSKSSAATWNKLERQAAPINNLSKSVNKKLDIIIKLLSGKKGKKDFDADKGFLNTIEDKILELLGYGAATATGGGLLRRLFRKNKGKIPKGRIPKGRTSRVKTPKGRIPKGKATKFKFPKRGRGKAGLLLGGLALAGGLLGYSDYDEEDSTLSKVAGAAINSSWYYEGGKDAIALSKAAKANKAIKQGQTALSAAKTVKQANQAKKAISAAKAAKSIALGVGKTGAKGALKGLGGGALAVGLTTWDIYNMEKQKKLLREQGNEREARKLAWQQRIKGGATAAGGVVGGVIGAAAGGVGAVPGAAAGTGIGSVVGDVGSWIFGKAYDTYWKWKDKKDAEKAKAQLEKQRMETDKEVARLKDYAILEMGEQINTITQLLYELTNNLSPSVQSDLDRQYINMVMSNNHFSPSANYGSNNTDFVSMNVNNPAVGV